MKLTFLYNPVFQIQQVKYKLLLVMKLTAILLLIGTLHLSAASFSQTVTISRKNATLATILKEIKQQTGYLFFYTGKVKTSDQRLNVELKNVPLYEALQVCLQNDNLSFIIVNKTIVLSPKQTDRGASGNEARPILLAVTGRVFDKETNQSIPGVNVSVKGIPGRRTQTSENGGFKLEAQPGELLLFSYIGYKPVEVKVTDSKTLTVLMESEVNAMKDIVVTGYQTIKKESYTGNAITIKGDDLKRTNPQNVLKAIQSFDPSFRLLDNNLAGSDPNAMPRINVRGATALPGLPLNKDDVLDRNNLSSSFNLPAFILDGFEVSLQKVVDLDINRIESINILKDAAATAVYGSRAANGVMVITTKAPVSGKLQLFYNSELTLSAPDLSGYDVLNAKDKIAYEQMAGLYRKLTPGVGDLTQDALDQELFNKLKNVASGVNTYWLSQPLRNAYAQKHSLNIQGGDQSFRYGIDMRYQTQPGVMKGVTRDRYSGGMDFTYMPSKKLIFRNNLSVNQTNGANSPYGSFSTYALMNPYYPKTDSTGRIVQELARWSIDRGYTDPVNGQYRTAYVFNPLFEAGLNNFNKDSYLELIDAFTIDYKLSESFRLKALMSLNQTTSKSDRFVSPLSSQFYDYTTDKLNNRGTYDYTTTNALGIDGNVTLNYNKQLGENFFNLVLGTNVIARKSDFKSISAQGFSNDKFTNIGFARIYKEESAPGGNVLINRTLGAFFSGNYSYKNKYLADASFRMDGSSSFGSNKRFAPFWATGLGWNIHNESFLQGSEIISQLRLKASTGQVGSVGFDPYMSRAIYQYQTGNWYSTGIGATLVGYGNDNLEWQKTTTYDAGLDLGLLKDRFVISPRYYYKLTKGLITDITLPPSTGFTTYKENLGDIANKGFELYLTANAFRNADWNVNVTANATHNTNTLVKLSNSLQAFNDKINSIQNSPDNNKEGEIGLATIPIVRYAEGQSLYTIYGVKSLGIDPENGREIYVKKDGSLTYDYDITDTQPIGDGTPKISGNLGSNISYKGFMLSFSLYYRFGGQTYNQTLVDRIENADPRFNVDSRALSQRWVKPGDRALYKNIADLTATKVSSRFVQKENLIELQSVYMSYDFKKDFIRRAGFQTLRTSITMNDIFRTSSVGIERGIDSPFARNITFSLQASF
ncbi:SusC/RagA family TonB-linked outer membrane protein [Pedobacter sp. MC2016-24]|uniref:SusC/RagA family TonB-linked outer membrane protein n=1 Tax=Pedobacter sp. MC2016-24 TaxID=2780090 RepID=UPI001881401B|nr:SusC/RagA family TonB-linked outer membrane protein [Pedobacter sp. MC2016-24]MBE9600341.1 SusC/RagA family TonB-linked outer membrane protein [Pedobacter sp. MC2016-24]